MGRVGLWRRSSSTLMIGCALGLSPYVQTPIYGLAAGVVVGAVCQFAAHMPMLARCGVPLRLGWDWCHCGVARILWLRIPARFRLAVPERSIPVDR